MLPFRSYLTFQNQKDLIPFVESRLEAWLTKRGKVHSRYRNLFTTGEAFTEGIHVVHDSGATLQVVASDVGPDTTIRRLYRFKETTSTGKFVVDVIATSSTQHSSVSSEPSRLLIEVSVEDSQDIPGQVAPPNVLTQILSETEATDGKTPVSASPRVIHSDEIHFLLESILDPDRTLPLVVASAIDNHQGRFRNFIRAVTSLTSKAVGTASVAVLEHDAIHLYNAAMPASHQLAPGRVRTFLPGVDISDAADGFRHKQLGPLTFARALNVRNHTVNNRLQEAFASTIRVRQLETPLPRAIDRHRELLLQRLREQEKRSELQSQRSHATKIPAPASEPLSEATEQSKSRIIDVAEKLTHFLRSRMRLKVAVPDDLVPEHIDVVDNAIAELEVEVELSRVLLEEQNADLHQAVEERERLAVEVDQLNLEAMTLESSVQKMSDELRWLRLQLKESQPERVGTYIPDVTWETPNSISEIAMILSPELTDRPTLTRWVHFVGSFDPVEEADARDKAGRDAARVWEAVHVLWDYAQKKSEGASEGSVHACLQSDSYTGKKVTVTNHAPRESNATLSQWASERTFTLPTGEPVLMDAHFRAGRDTRLHYFDDTGSGASGKIYIGYIGPHLSNTKTKNR